MMLMEMAVLQIEQPGGKTIVSCQPVRPLGAVVREPHLEPSSSTSPTASMSQDAITIRPLRPSTDIGAITEIYADAVMRTTATYEINAPNEAEMRQRLADSVQANGFPCFVAEETTCSPPILGYAYVTAYRPRPAYRYAVEHSVYVAPSARRRGVGRLLMTAIIQECEKMGFRQIIAVIGESGEGNLENNESVRFHQKLGFRISGTLQGSGFKFGRWLDTTLMQLSINGGSNAPVDPESVPEIKFQRGKLASAKEDDARSEITATSGINTAYTPASDSTANESCFRYRPLSHGHKFLIRERQSGKVITYMNSGGLGLQDMLNAKRADMEWLCVEKNGYFGLQNPKSGRYIGHNGNHSEALQASATVLNAWECITARDQPGGGYKLLMPHWLASLKTVVIAEDGKTLVRRDHGDTLWDFIMILDA